MSMKGLGLDEVRRSYARTDTTGWLAGRMDGYGYRMVMELGRKRDHSTAPFFRSSVYIFS